MFTIGIYQSLSNSTMYEHRCLDNIKKLHTPTFKLYNQQQYKAIIEAEIVSIPERSYDNGPMSPGPYVTV